MSRYTPIPATSWGLAARDVLIRTPALLIPFVGIGALLHLFAEWLEERDQRRWAKRLDVGLPNICVRCDKHLALYIGHDLCHYCAPGTEAREARKPERKMTPPKGGTAVHRVRPPPPKPQEPIK